MTVRITLLNSSGFSAPSAYEDPEDKFKITSAYEGIDNFSIDIKFEGVYPDPLSPPLEPVNFYANALNVTSSYDWASIGITLSKPNAYTVRLVGPGINVFTGQYYKFVLTDFTEQVLPADTTIPFYSLDKYQMPSPTFIQYTYPFAVTLYSTYNGTTGSGSVIENVTLNQWWFWSYSSAVSNIASCRTRGLK